MTLALAWLLFGAPSLLLGLALFIGRSTWRVAAGYLALIAGFVAMAFVDRASAAVLGAVILLLLASGRGGRMETERDPARRGADVPGLVGTDRTLDPPKQGE